MSGSNSNIIRASTGLLNTVNDTVIGGQSVGSIGLTDPPSAYSGQLGKWVEYAGDQIAQMFDSTVGTLYAGRFRYVRMRDEDIDSPALTPGKILFWDTTLTNWQNYFQVTRDENLSSVDNAVAIAGIYLGGFEPGNYGFIQDLGMVPVRFRAALTTAGAIGSRVYAAGSGDTGSDQGTADVLTTDSTSLANARYLGNAITTAPDGGSLTPVQLMFHNILG
jgi:hypothetical protein